MLQAIRQIGMLIPAELRLVAIIFATAAASMAVAVMLHDSFYPGMPAWKVYATARKLDPENRFATKLDFVQMVSQSPTLSWMAGGAFVLFVAIVVMRISGTGFGGKRKTTD